MAVAVAVLALLASGCSSSSSQPRASAVVGAAPSASTRMGPGGVQEVTIHATNGFRFDPSVITAHVGTVRVTLVDAGSYPHNLSVSAVHVTSTTVSGAPGAMAATFTLTFTHPGRYGFVCTYHSSAGMKGDFVVTA